MDMDMFFHFGTELHNFMFKGVEIFSIQSFVGLCIGIGLLCVTSEGVRVAQLHFNRHVPKAPAHKTQQRVHDTSQDAAAGEEGSRATSVQYLLDEAGGTHSHYDTRILHLLFRTFLYVLHLTVAYFIMLCVMTYNAYIFIAVLIGTGIGYLLFGFFEMMLTSKMNPYLSKEVAGGMSRVVRVGSRLCNVDHHESGSPHSNDSPCEHNDDNSHYANVHEDEAGPSGLVNMAYGESSHLTAACSKESNINGNDAGPGGVNAGYDATSPLNDAATSALCQSNFGGADTVIVDVNCEADVNKDACSANNTKMSPYDTEREQDSGTESTKDIDDRVKATEGTAEVETGVLLASTHADCSVLSSESEGLSEKDRTLLLSNADASDTDEHRTSDIAGLLSQEVTAEVHT